MDLQRRRRVASRAAYVGGLLLVLTGSTGAAAIIAVGHGALASVAPEVADFLLPLFLVLMIAALLGGFSVVLGGYVLHRHHRFLGKVLIWLGAGAGLLPFALNIVLLIVTGRNPLESLAATAMTLQGLGVLLALFAQAWG